MVDDIVTNYCHSINFTLYFIIVFSVHNIFLSLQQNLCTNRWLFLLWLLFLLIFYCYRSRFLSLPVSSFFHYLFTYITHRFIVTSNVMKPLEISLNIFQTVDKLHFTVFSRYAHIHNKYHSTKIII